MAERAPNEEEYMGTVSRTTEYFNNFFTTTYENDPNVNFLGAQAQLDFNLYEAGIPAERFNIYMDYAYMDLYFTADSTNLPTPDEAFVLMRDSITAEYITDYVQVEGTPFFSTSEVVFRRSTMSNPDDRSNTQNDSNNSDQRSVPIAAVAVSSGAALVILAAAFMLYRRRRIPKDSRDGIYTMMDNKIIEGYFSDRSATEVSEAPSSSRFTKLPMVAEERNEDSQLLQDE
jgi:hypothetical protein